MLVPVTAKRTVPPLGRNVRRLREAKGWSQPELADRAGLARPTIARVELGYATATTLETAERLAEALGVTLDELTSDPDLQAGAVSMAPLVEAFIASGLAQQLPGGPATEEELEWARSIPVVYFGGSPPGPMSIYHLILARRSAAS